MTTIEVMSKLREAWITAIGNDPRHLREIADSDYDKVIDDASIPILREFGEALREEDAKLVLTYCSAFRKKTGTNPYPIEISQRIHTVKIE